MVVSTFQKRGLLRSFKSQADAQSVTLYVFLLSLLTTPADTLKKGKILISSNAGSVSAAYSLQVGLSQAQLLEVVSELVDRYEQAKATLIAGGKATPTDQEIYDQELADLRAIKGFTSNWMYLAK